MKAMNTFRSYRFMVLGVCWLAGAFAGMDANLFSVMLKSIMAEMGGTSGQVTNLGLATYAISSFLFGWMAGGIFMGMASDRYGRAKMLSISILFYACATGLTAAVDNLSALILCRFITGLGVGGTMVGISVFLSETWGTSSRAVALSILITSYQVGVLLSGVAAHVMPEWRHAFLSGALPAILAIVVFQLFQEPVSHNPTVDALIQSHDSTRKNVWLGAIIFGSLLVGYWASLTWIPTWLQELLGSEASGNEKNVATMIHALCAIAGCFLAGPLSDVLGRRPVMLISYAGALITSLWMFLGHQGFSPLLYAHFGALGFFIGMAQAVMYIYLPELFPKASRATCVGICLNAGRLVTVFAVLCMGAMLHWFGGYMEALCAFATVYIVGIGFAWIAPETKLFESQG